MGRTRRCSKHSYPSFRLLLLCTHPKCLKGNFEMLLSSTSAVALVTQPNTYVPSFARQMQTCKKLCGSSYGQNLLPKRISAYCGSKRNCQFSPLYWLCFDKGTSIKYVRQILGLFYGDADFLGRAWAVAVIGLSTASRSARWHVQGRGFLGQRRQLCLLDHHLSIVFRIVFAVWAVEQLGDFGRQRRHNGLLDSLLLRSGHIRLGGVPLLFLRLFLGVPVINNLPL